MTKKLTEREVQVLTLVEACNTNKEIARLLTIATGTIDTHLKNIFRKMGISNRMQAAYIFRTHTSNSHSQNRLGKEGDAFV